MDNSCPRCHGGGGSGGGVGTKWGGSAFHARGSYHSRAFARGLDLNIGVPSSAASGATTTLALNDLCDQLDDVEDILRRLQSDRHSDSKHLAQLSAELAGDRRNAAQTAELTTKLLSSQGNLTEKFAAFESSVVAVIRNAVQPQELEQRTQEARALVQQLRTDVVQLASDTDSRLAEHQALVESLAKRVNTLERERSGIERLTAVVEQLSRGAESQDGRAAKMAEDITNLRLAVAKNESDLTHKISLAQQESAKSLVDEALKLREAIAGVESRMADADRTDEELANRIDETAQYAASVEKKADDKTSAMFTALNEVRNTMDQQAQMVAASLRTLETDINRIEDSVASNDRAHQQRWSDLSKNHDDVSTVLRSLETRMAIESARRESEADASRTEQDASFRRQIAANHTENQKLLEERVAALRDDIRRVQQDADARHQRLVESTHQAIHRIAEVGLIPSANGSADQATTSTTISLIRQELSALRETVASHRTALESQRYDAGNFEAGFNEIKEWLRDMEARQISRTEMENRLLELSSELSTFKQQTQSAESLLGQRLEAERSHRESELSGIRSQIQRLHTVLKLTTHSSPSTTTASP